MTVGQPPYSVPLSSGPRVYYSSTVMAAEMEPPPLGDGEQTDFRELDDTDDLFVSTVDQLEVRLYCGKRKQSYSRVVLCASSGAIGRD